MLWGTYINKKPKNNLKKEKKTERESYFLEMSWKLESYSAAIRICFEGILSEIS